MTTIPRECEPFAGIRLRRGRGLGWPQQYLTLNRALLEEMGEPDQLALAFDPTGGGWLILTPGPGFRVSLHLGAGQVCITRWAAQQGIARQNYGRLAAVVRLCDRGAFAVGPLSRWTGEE